MAKLTGSQHYICISAITDGAEFEDMLVLGVEGASTSNMARVAAQAPDGSNAQAWFQTSIDSDYVSIRNANTGKAIDIYKGVLADGTVPIQWTSTLARNQALFLEPAGAGVTVNGVTYPTYQIHVMRSQTSRVLTAYEGGGRVKAQPVGYPDGASGDDYGTPNAQQLWAFVPSSMVTGDFAVPSTVRAAVTRTADTNSAVFQLASGSLWPSWVGTRTTLQARYRHRTRGTHDAANELSEWSDWQSFAGDDENLGWGASSAAASLTASKSGKRMLAATALQLIDLGDGATYDRVDYEVQLREFAAAYGRYSIPYHGGVADATLRQVYPLSFGPFVATWSPAGLIVSWSLNWDHGDGITITVESTDGLFAARKGSGYGGTDDMLIPTSALTRRVSVGDTIGIQITANIPADNSGRRVAQQVTVTHDGTIGTDLTISAAPSGHLATVTASVATAQAWLVIPRGHGDRYVPLDGSSPWVVAPPLGVPWRVYAVAESGGRWSTAEEEFPAIVETPAAHHLTTQGLDHDLPIVARKGGKPTVDWSHSRTRETVESAGREFPVSTLGEAVKSTCKVAGDLLAWEGGAQLADEYDALAFAGRCILRTAFGGWHQVGIASSTIDMSRADVVPVEFNLQEEVW